MTRADDGFGSERSLQRLTNECFVLPNAGALVSVKRDSVNYELSSTARIILTASTRFDVTYWSFSFSIGELRKTKTWRWETWASCHACMNSGSIRSWWMEAGDKPIFCWELWIEDWNREVGGCYPSKRVRSSEQGYERMVTFGEG